MHTRHKKFYEPTAPKKAPLTDFFLSLVSDLFLCCCFCCCRIETCFVHSMSIGFVCLSLPRNILKLVGGRSRGACSLQQLPIKSFSSTKLSLCARKGYTARESRSMFCQCILGGGAAPSPKPPCSLIFLRPTSSARTAKHVLPL